MDAHLDYLRHLKESMETIRDIIEEAKVVKPLDRSIVSACRYTKHSQELLEYVIGTCPHDSQPFTSQKTNVPVPPSSGVDSCPIASESQPMSHVKPNRIAPAKGDTKLQIDDQPKKNKSHLRTSTRNDSRSRLKRTVINSHSDSVFQTCAKCFTLFNHDLCMATCLQSAMATPSSHYNRSVVRKVQQVWKPKHVRQVWKPTETLREALQITPINRNQAFDAPPSINGLIDFVNQLGYPKLVMNLSTVVTNDLFQPWWALLTIIKLCLMGKTFGFERPRAPVLQILWGIITRANIDYAERIWEEFTQSIHTFIENKQNLSWHTSRKKRATLIVIPSVRFTKLIIHHLQRKHMFHPRPDSLLHLSNEEPVLGYLKFSAKGTKKEIFGMLIPGRLITANIREASYYQEYQKNMAKHRGFLASETRSTQDLPAPKPAKPARKPQS
nr:integrase, catalytic region, zinc finger, CCHC-type, peptidase aspartic, catalytic [Tanacetum cinerariifolium]